MYPSEDLKNWCTQIKNLWRNTQCEELRTVEEQNYGWLASKVKDAIDFAPLQEQKKQLASALFWSVWIDQVIYTVTINQNEPLYQQFREKYPFPKLYSQYPHNAEPFIILDTFVPSLELLLKDKDDYWGEIKKYFSSLGQDELVDKAELKFKHDLVEREFPEIYNQLWNY